MTKVFEEKVLKNGYVDTKNYRYRVKETDRSSRIERLQLHKLNTVAALSDWETVKTIWTTWACDYHENSNPSTSCTMDTVVAPGNYTATKYKRDCLANADEDWCDLFKHGYFTLFDVG